MNQIKISIIVPVYNQERNIRECIKSLTNQSLEEIEMIFVNDASSDDSKKMLEEYSTNDKRIKIVDLEKNSGTSVARKRGVEVALGKYIMFLDCDDKLRADACQVVWDEMEKDPVDILQFGTKVRFAKKVSDYEQNDLNKVLTPYEEKSDGNLVEKSFIENKWKFTLWNKAYNAVTCKKAFSKIVDEYMVVSEDLYAFFLISYYAKLYRGIKEKLYVYNYGCGITNNSHINLKQFQKDCTKFVAVKALRTFLEEENVFEQYERVYKKINNDFIRDIIYRWRNILSIEDARKGYDYLIEIIGVKNVVASIAQDYWNDCPEILERIARRYSKKEKGKKVSRIGMYYHRICNGGAEKVVASLIPLWMKGGYEVVLITDEEPNDKDYPIPEEVERVVIRNYRKSEKSDYAHRAEDWENIIKKYDLDTVVYSSCNCITIMWDVCMLKGLECNVIVETHSMFSGTMWYAPVFASYLPVIYRMVDKVVALSRIDVTFWQNYCPAYYIPNPIDIPSKEQVSNLDAVNVLWVGRISPEKRPEAIIEAFEMVHYEVPEARLIMVGEGDSDEDLKKLQKKAKELEIEDCIEFEGFQKNVDIYYREAAVLTITSKCESFSMVLAESKGYGVPTVMYELPNLELVRDGKGVISVPQNDVYSLATGIINLLKNRVLREECGRQARESIEEFVNTDILKEWQQVFNDCSKEVLADDIMDENVSLMLDFLFKDFLHGLCGTDVCGSESYGDLSRVYKSIAVHEEVLQRHEEVVNRHEEVVNRHEQVVNDDWAWLKNLERRVTELERERSLFKRGTRKIKRYFNKQ